MNEKARNKTALVVLEEVALAASASTLNNISFAGPVEAKIIFSTKNKANNFSEFDPHWKKNVGCDNCQKDKKDACEFRKNENKSGGTSFQIFSNDLKIPNNSTKDYPTDLDTHDSLCVKESLEVQKQSTLNLNAIAVRVWNDFKTGGDQETVNIAVPEGTGLESTGGKAYLMQ